MLQKLIFNADFYSILRDATFNRGRGSSQISMMKENIFLQSTRGFTIMVVMWCPLSGDYFHLTIRLSLVTWNSYFVSNSKFIKLIIWTTRILEIGMKVWLNIQILNTLNLDDCFNQVKILKKRIFCTKFRCTQHVTEVWLACCSIKYRACNMFNNVRTCCHEM